MQPGLCAVVLMQCALVIWLHHRARRTNLDRLRAHLAHGRPLDGGAWVAGPHGFHVCARCVDALLLVPTDTAADGCEPPG